MPAVHKPGHLLPDILYGKRERYGCVDTRYGSVKLGAVLTTMSGGSMPRAWLGQVWRLGISYGPAGGVEAGLDGIAPELRSWERIWYRANGCAFALNWTRRDAVAG